MSSNAMNIVGVVGGNGYVGSQVVQHLIKHAHDGKVKLVLFYRAGRPIKVAQDVASENIETREIDLGWPLERLVEAVKGIHLCIAALAAEALGDEAHLVDALKKSSTLRLYIPSTYSITWDDEDLADPKLGPAIKGFFIGIDHAKKVGLPVCHVYCGTFVNWAFDMGFLFPPIKENAMVANNGMLENGLPITTSDHIGNVIAILALTKDLSSLANTTHSIVTFRPTGNDFVKLFTELHGGATKVTDFTPKMRAEKIADGPFGPVAVGYIDKWAEDKYAYGRNGMVSYDKEYEGPGLAEVAKAFM